MTTRRPPAKQTKNFTVSVKTALLRRGIGMSELATLVGRPRTSVSKAVNQNRFPNIQERIREELGVA